MSTLNDLVEGIRSSLHSFTGLHEQVTWLTSPCDADDLTMSVAGSEEILRGVAEVDNELIYVHTSTGNTLTLAPFGRGYRRTTAATHAINTPVTFDPPFPRAEIKRSVQQAVEALHPTLYRVRTTDVTPVAQTVGHALPTDAEGVLRVEAKLPGDPTFDNWVDYGRWDFDPHSPVSGGKTLNLYEGLPIGSTLRVVYAAKFGAFATDDSTLESTGLHESYADLLTYAVTSRMVRFLDPARLQISSVENVSRSQVVQAGDAGRLANQLYAMYQTRLAEERRRLLTLYPPQTNFLPR